MDLFDFPDEVLCIILGKLSILDFARTASSCTTFLGLCCDITKLKRENFFDHLRAFKCCYCLSYNWNPNLCKCQEYLCFDCGRRNERHLLLECHSLQCDSNIWCYVCRFGCRLRCIFCDTLITDAKYARTDIDGWVSCVECNKKMTGKANSFHLWPTKFMAGWISIGSDIEKSDDAFGTKDQYYYVDDYEDKFGEDASKMTREQLIKKYDPLWFTTKINKIMSNSNNVPVSYYVNPSHSFYSDATFQFIKRSNNGFVKNIKHLFEDEENRY